jgi:hypothetical protein
VRPTALGMIVTATLTLVSGAAQSDRHQAAAQPPRPVSPHWPHIRTQVSDYRISYLNAAVRNDEYVWTARHFDRITLDFGDRGSVPVYRRLNPAAEIYRYALNWTVVRPGELRADDRAVGYYSHMRDWYARHRQYRLEDAFLHDRSRCRRETASEGCRITFKIWTTNRWVLNPGDAGLRAYQRDRLASVASDVDGLFLDEHSSGDFRDKLDIGRTLEYADWAAYDRDMLVLLRALRAALGPRKRILLNSATYVTSFDAQMVAATGGTHAEAFNNPFYPQMERRWRFAESVLAAGAWMDLGVGGDTPARYTRGNSATPTARRRLWELASYYLIAPVTPGPLAYNPGIKSKQPFAEQWVAAAEVDVGKPDGARRVFAEGRDRSGRAYRVWARDYDGALVLVRPIVEWGSTGYGDETGVELRLPPGNTYRPLDADGRVGPPETRLLLRASEAAILLLGSRRSAALGSRLSALGCRPARSCRDPKAESREQGF